MSDDLSRRQFLEFMAVAAGVSLAGCSSQDSAPEATNGILNASKNADGSFSLPISALPATGKATPFNFPGDAPGLLAGLAEEKLVAFSAKCTHSGCTVEWKGERGKEMRCPCHDSVFNLQGAPMGGPAKQPLARFSVEKRGDSLILKLV